MRIALLLTVPLWLAACGVAYQSPQVKPGPDVQIVTMTLSSIAQANQSPYTPRALPAAFSQTAGTGGNPTVRSANITPTLPPPNARPPLPARLPPDSDPGPYLIGIGDRVQLLRPLANDSFDDTGAAHDAQQFTVRDDGTITIPDIGRVTIANLTVDAAEAAVFEQFVTAGRDPSFSLDMAGFNARKVTIGGAVATPAVVPVTLAPLTLSAVLAMAGGTTTAPQENGVLQLYRDGSLYRIPLENLAQSADLQSLRLQDGDSLFVAATNDQDGAQAYFEQQILLTQAEGQARDVALRSLATEVALRREELAERRSRFEAQLALGAVPRDHVYLFGEVGAQARFPLPFAQQASLADALFEAAGGVPLETGNVSQIYVLRRSAEGTTAWHLDGGDVAQLTLAPLFELRPNDLIFVGEQPITRWGRVIQQLSPTLVSTGVAVAN